MNILWINMTVPPEADMQIGGLSELKNTGGWVLGLAHFLSKEPDVTLAIASVSPLVRKLTVIKGKEIKYFIVPESNNSKASDEKQKEYWQQVYKEFSPDIVHIHGTEYKHALTWLKANGNKNTVVSLQGILTAIYKRYYDGMSQADIIRNITPRDIYKGTIFSEANAYKRTSVYEREILKNVKHVIGRTQWDRTQMWAINKNARYHFCNEILRYEFYEQELWQYDKCDKHTIFVNQASMPYKGLHQLIKAMPLILREYPDTRIRVAGFDITDMSLKRKIMRTGYGRYIIGLEKKYHIQDKISFTGRLNAQGMIEKFRKCNVFVLPSSIENSPNALCEAQILGAPFVASNVGGVLDFVDNNDPCELTYNFIDPVELARKVCVVFENSEKHNPEQESYKAKVRHSPVTICQDMLNIYQEIQKQQEQ